MYSHSNWQEIWSFKTDRFTVICDIQPEDFSPDEHFEDQETLQMIRDGQIDWFMARMRVLMDHRFEIGADYLGGCAYFNASDFVKGDDRNGYFRDMVRSSLDSAREYLKKYPLPYQRAA